jgi:hypothetical protein
MLYVVFSHFEFSPRRSTMTSLLLAKLVRPNITTQTTWIIPLTQKHPLSLGLVSTTMSDMPILSQSAKELLGKVRMIVPPMLEKFHKGTSLSSPRLPPSF